LDENTAIFLVARPGLATASPRPAIRERVLVFFSAVLGLHFEGWNSLKDMGRTFFPNPTTAYLSERYFVFYFSIPPLSAN